MGQADFDREDRVSRAWRDDGKLRHASYKGLRDVQDNASVFTIV
jgi:hypothetical protein